MECQEDRPLQEEDIAVVYCEQPNAVQDQGCKINRRMDQPEQPVDDPGEPRNLTTLPDDCAHHPQRNNHDDVAEERDASIQRRQLNLDRSADVLTDDDLVGGNGDQGRDRRSKRGSRGRCCRWIDIYQPVPINGCQSYTSSNWFRGACRCMYWPRRGGKSGVGGTR